MDDFWRLVLLSLAMLIGCYLAGSIPLAINLSEEKLRLVTVLGAGLLVGTALAVIIPEGVHALYQHRPDSHVVEKAIAEEVAKEGAVHEHGHGHEHEHEEEYLHVYIGFALVIGFVFMLLVDQIGGAHLHSAQGDSENSNRTSTGRSKITATLGLVVHAAADGIAMGAAAKTARPDVEMIVFIAIMLHKAPAAFGLVTFLLSENFPRNKIRLHLFIFALAAPLGAIFTYIGLNQGTREALETINATGITMLFSAGTFLYVATVHVLPEIVAMGHSHDSTGADQESIGEPKPVGFTKIELFSLVLGCLAPLVLSLNHHH
ncbi:zinc transporter ZIP9-like [Saccoglossus kowalevskii]|uniref:Zinc transporter ZIP9-like n=1 Tax=Saccoglossus kowalevskii TaxID=10224 RepID=A0ABM0GM58_SACKO|nr:PREDICTED: zinc transporter ZIP9-like [Saccoglossus kowalevskii]